jgi:hypothetical protein
MSIMTGRGTERRLLTLFVIFIFLERLLVRCRLYRPQPVLWIRIRSDLDPEKIIRADLNLK